MSWKKLFGGDDAITTDDVVREAELARAADASRASAASPQAHAVETHTGETEPVETLVAQGKLIDAIKAYRESHDVSLAEAKAAVDAIAAGRPPVPVATTAPPADADIDALLREDQFIEAIRAYRERYGGSLVAAKAAVEARREQLGRG